MKKISGIYKIKNIINSKVYIGSSINIKSRWQKHISELRNGRHSNKHLLESYKKHGEQNFQFSILEEVKELESLILKEQHYLDFYKSYEKENGYNLRKIADSNYGYKHTKESVEKFRIASTGKTHTEEAKKRISLANKGRIFSEETKLKMSLAKKGKSNHWKGKKRTEKQKKLISEMAKKRVGELNANSKLKNIDIPIIKDLFFNQKKYINDIAKLFNVSRSTIKRVLHNKSFKN